MLLFFAIILTLTSLVTWWLSGFDPRLTGNNREDLTHRSLRCGLTVFLMAAGLGGAMADPQFACLRHFGASLILPPILQAPLLRNSRQI